MKKAITLMLVLLGVFALSAAKLSEVEMMAYRVKPAVVLVENIITASIQFERNGRIVQTEETFWTMGSAFFINPEGYLVTNGHVVQPYYLFQNKREQLASSMLDFFIARMLVNEGRVLNEDNYNRWKRIHSPTIVSIKVSPTVTLSNGEKYIYEIKKYSPPITEGGKDIAVIKIERDNCPVLMLGDSSKIVLQQEIFPIGYPAIVDPRTLTVLSEKTRLEPTITRGTISALRMDYKGVPVIQTDAAITMGNSGGPAVNVKGEVIGISTYASGVLTPIGQIQVQGYSFLIPINTAKEFIRDAGVEYNVISDFTKTYNALLDAVWNENWVKAKELVAVALSYMKDQPDLERLQKKIYMELEHMSWFQKLWSQNKAVVIIGFILIVLVVVILIVALKPSAPPASRPETAAGVTETVSAEPGTVAEAEVAGYVTVIIRGQESGTHPIPSTGVIVGRDPAKADIVISEPTVSKTHCKIIPRAGGFYVIDLGSTNGTFVAGKKITESPVNIGETVQLGRKGDILLVLKASR